MRYNNILITGKTGTVGSNLNFGFGINRSLYDLRNSQDALDAVQDANSDAIVHCAAKVGGLYAHLNNKYDLFHDNILINTNLINAAKIHKVSRVLSFLSSCVFGPNEKPCTEQDIYCQEPFSAHLGYGHAKRMLELQSRICHEEFGLKYNCVIPTNIYGINDDFNLETGHVVGVLIHKCFLAKQNNADFIVWGDGNQEREFLFTEDVKNLTLWALENYEEKVPLIFSNNTPIKIKDVVDLIVKELNFKGNVIFDTSKPSGQKQRSLSGNKLKTYNNFSFTNIEKGVKITIDWFLKNYDNARK